jgi:serine/threonine-protein kinase
MLMPRTDHALGDTVGRYRLLGELARGGMGIVYVAAAQGPAGFSKLVALKELRPELVDDAELLTMFMEEARLAARLSHPNIVQTNDVDESDGRHFIAMEYLEGRSLHSILKRFAGRGGFPQRLALSVLRDVLAALDYAHDLSSGDGPLNIVHRDISPLNVLVTFEGHTKVIDFGIAKARDSALETKTGVLKGCANYMAPEQLVRRADRRSDIFAVGAILFEVLTGRRLWHGMSELEILAALTRGQIPELQAHAVPIDTSPLLVHACEKALSARPEDRFSSAAELRDALDQQLWSNGNAPRNREVSDLLLQEFDRDRQRTRGMIEGALLRLQAGESGYLETFEQAEVFDGRGSSRSRVSPSVRRSFGNGVSNGTGAHSQVSRSVSLSGLRDPSLVGHHELASVPGSLMRHNATLEPLPHAPWPSFLDRWRPWLVAGGLASVFMVTTAIVVGVERTPVSVAPVPYAAPIAQPAAMAQPRPGAVPMAAAAPRELPVPRLDETVILSVGVAPSTAAIYIDGQKMPSNPFIGHFAKTTGNHRLRAVAPGYQAKERTVSFADNVMIDLSLVPAPIAPAPAVHHERPAASSRVATPARAAGHAPEAVAPASAPVVADPPANRAERKSDIAPRGEWAPPRKRSIDTSNPYEDER